MPACPTCLDTIYGLPLTYYTGVAGNCFRYLVLVSYHLAVPLPAGLWPYRNLHATLLMAVAMGSGRGSLLPCFFSPFSLALPARKTTRRAGVERAPAPAHARAALHAIALARTITAGCILTCVCRRHFTSPV